MFAGSAALTLGVSGAHAAAIERTLPSFVRLLFEEGRYGELGVSYVDPDQNGDGADLTALGAPGVTVEGNTGDVFKSYRDLSAAYKADLTDRFSYALLFDQPYGADTRYGAGSFPAGGFSYDGTTAEIDTYQLTAMAAYDPTPNIKVFAGLRAEQLYGKTAIPFINDYQVESDEDWGLGWLAGAAYHRPEIALRVALTYASAIDHDLRTDEFFTDTGDVETKTDVETPQSVTLEVQSGVAPRTLVFGSVRWVDWTEFTIDPPTYRSVVGRPLVEYEDDWWTYSAGVGRQLTDTLAGALSLAYEPPVDTELTTLGPYDGRTTLTAALSYDIGRANISGGVTYGRLGDAKNILRTDFDDGSIWGAGLRIGYSF